LISPLINQSLISFARLDTRADDVAPLITDCRRCQNSKSKAVTSSLAATIISDSTSI
jgi:hypothetical protein